MMASGICSGSGASSPSGTSIWTSTGAAWNAVAWKAMVWRTSGNPLVVV